MTKKTAASAPDGEDANEQEAHWEFHGSRKALEAITRRDEAQANALAEAMRLLQRQTGRSAQTSKTPTERKLLDQVRKLKRALRRGGEKTEPVRGVRRNRRGRGRRSNSGRGIHHRH